VLIYSDLQGESICTRGHENNSLAWGFVGPAILTGRQDYRVCDGGAILAGCRGRGALTQEGSPFIFPTGILPVCVWYLRSPVTTQQPRYERLLYQPDSWEIIHPIPGVVSLLLAREEGATYLKATKLGAEPYHIGPRSPRLWNDDHGCKVPEGLHYVGPHLAGRIDKHHMPPPPLAKKVPNTGLKRLSSPC
jgi:hypothetical protein